MEVKQNAVELQYLIDAVAARSIARAGKAGTNQMMPLNIISFFNLFKDVKASLSHIFSKFYDKNIEQLIDIDLGKWKNIAIKNPSEEPYDLTFGMTLDDGDEVLQPGKSIRIGKIKAINQLIDDQNQDYLYLLYQIYMDIFFNGVLSITDDSEGVKSNNMTIASKLIMIYTIMVQKVGSKYLTELAVSSASLALDAEYSLTVSDSWYLSSSILIPEIGNKPFFLASSKEGIDKLYCFNKKFRKFDNRISIQLDNLEIEKKKSDIKMISYVDAIDLYLRKIIITDEIVAKQQLRNSISAARDTIFTTTDNILELYKSHKSNQQNNTEIKKTRIGIMLGNLTKTNNFLETNKHKLNDMVLNFGKSKLIKEVYTTLILDKMVIDKLTASQITGYYDNDKLTQALKLYISTIESIHRIVV